MILSASQTYGLTITSILSVLQNSDMSTGTLYFTWRTRVDSSAFGAPDLLPNRTHPNRGFLATMLSLGYVIEQYVIVHDLFRLGD